jgi:hypothetical protein
MGLLFTLRCIQYPATGRPPVVRTKVFLDKTQILGYNNYRKKKGRDPEMAKITKTQNDKALRDSIFHDIFQNDCGMYEYQKINDRQYGVILTDLNGHKRYVRIGAIVAEERDDVTAEELMRMEINAYKAKQVEKAEKLLKKEAKIAKDKKKREEEKDDPHQYLPHEVTV